MSDLVILRGLVVAILVVGITLVAAAGLLGLAIRVFEKAMG